MKRSNSVCYCRAVSMVTKLQTACDRLKQHWASDRVKATRVLTSLWMLCGTDVDDSDWFPCFFFFLLLPLPFLQHVKHDNHKNCRFTSGLEEVLRHTNKQRCGFHHKVVLHQIRTVKLLIRGIFFSNGVRKKITHCSKSTSTVVASIFRFRLL